jgi:hypothetical protein
VGILRCLRRIPDGTEGIESVAIARHFDPAVGKQLQIIWKFKRE